MMKQLSTIGIESISYRLPKEQLSVEKLSRQGMVTSSVESLRSFGFNNCNTLGDEDMFPLLIESARATIAEAALAPLDIDTLILYSGLGFSYGQSERDQSEELGMFRYPVARLAHELGIPHARTLALSQEGCNGVFSSLSLLKELPENSRNILCVFGDMLPQGMSREIMYNIMSDSAASAMVRRDAKKNYIKHQSTLRHPYYWDTPKREAELLAAYFPMAERAIREGLQKAELSMDDIDWVIPHNVSCRSWEILAKLTGIPMERIWLSNVPRLGHTVSTDHLINLRDMEEQGILKRGDTVLLFGFGFGASWSTMIIEH
jgi:3-oxoacyl-[acyl-carrier-protein] synthase-3